MWTNKGKAGSSHAPTPPYFFGLSSPAFVGSFGSPTTFEGSVVSLNPGSFVGSAFFFLQPTPPEKSTNRMPSQIHRFISEYPFNCERGTSENPT